MAYSTNFCYPTGMKTIVQFTISQEDEIYTADGVNVPIVTEGATFEELQENIRDAVALYFEGSAQPA